MSGIYFFFDIGMIRLVSTIDCFPNATNIYMYTL
jgi:hypothetical protein